MESLRFGIATWEFSKDVGFKKMEMDYMESRQEKF